jgi:hypothetical protein
MSNKHTAIHIISYATGKNANAINELAAIPLA